MLGGQAPISVWIKVSRLLSPRDWQSTGIHWVRPSALAGIMMIRLLRHNRVFGTVRVFL
ncbi:ferredoxin-thioredoxin reductase catalytic chain chloroplastic [Phtheirospermum japonicum]|uniref:Ferredoxin-thioredoxin reductase catalytic chain chloroplastic n=1 Tax=Phtheirospermum japonicum TaxID=374723 RepID=A0A830C7L6_9LAMI|nr:ferredoxin-thioredoxin reductase catalytic chain chloroplastic [Phtheirospermum japonicum]